MSKNYRNSLSQQMQNADFKREWEALEPEFQTINAMIDESKNRNLTQEQLAGTEKHE